jgi:Domain of unknown function (DUF4347)/FG-GAP-like repeat
MLVFSKFTLAYKTFSPKTATFHRQQRTITSAHSINFKLPKNQQRPMKNNFLLSPQNYLTAAIPTTTLVVFDERVSDIELLTQALLPGSIGFTIRAQADGLETITQLLAATGASYLAIVAHGEPGVFHLGKSPIGINQLQAQSHLLAAWQVQEIALYSCEVGQGQIGQALIYQLSELTGATVAAATTKTGCTALGGSWDLAVTTGAIGAPELFVASILQTYPAVLATVEQVIKKIDLTVKSANPFTGIAGTLKIDLDSALIVGETDLNFKKVLGIPTLEYTLTPGTGVTKVTGDSFTIASGTNQVNIDVDIKPSVFATPGLVFGTAFASIAGDSAAETSDAAIVYNPGNGKLFFNPNGATAGFGAGGNFATFSINPTPKKTVRNDFNGDKKSDILWRSDSGWTSIWQMNGATVTATSLTSTPNLAPSWEAAGTGDFNGDGKSDILWRNTDGSVAVWTMDGTNVASSLTSIPKLASSWKSAGTGDFNGDGKSDILWRNTDGSVAVWTMDGTNVSSSLTSIPKLDSSWKINGTGDFNGDGKADILWRNSNTGAVDIWQMDGATVVSSNLTSTSSLDSSWKISGTGDFNGDGKADILWRKDSGAVVVWTMDGTNVISSTPTSLQPDNSAWKIAAPIL